MRALFVQHDHVSPTGPLSDRLRHHGFTVDEITVVTQENFAAPNVPFVFPDPAEYDVIVPVGSPWGAWDDACIGTWLLPEVEWIRATMERDIPVLGVCFGGQVMARALGGTVAPGPRAEIGWTAIHSDLPDLVAPGPWFQFHYDRWSVPDGATEVARNALASQAFVAGRSLAVQFHPELTAATLEGWLSEGGEEQVRRDGQDPGALMAHTRAEEPSAIVRTHALLDAFLERVARVVG